MKNKCFFAVLLFITLPASSMQNPGLENVVIPLWMYFMINVPRAHNTHAFPPLANSSSYVSNHAKNRRIKKTQQPRGAIRTDRIHQPH